MRQSVRIGRVAGVPVGMHWSVLVISVLLMQGLAVAYLPAAVPGATAVAYWLAAVGLTGLFMVALLAHELAHALTARHYRVRVKSITLWLLGGVSELDGEPPNPRADLLIALAGPLVSLAAAGLFAGAAILAGVAGTALLHMGLGWLAVVNALMAVFNLLPGAPLDGGRVLAAIVWRLRGDRAQGRRTAARAGVAIGWIMAATGLALTVTSGTLNGLWFIVLGWYLAMVARTEATSVRLTAALTGLRAEQVMSTPAVCGYTGQTVASFVNGTAATHPHRAYPVVDLDGLLAGLVTVGRLAAVRRDAVARSDSPKS